MAPLTDEVPDDIDACSACQFETKHLHKCGPPFLSKRKEPFWFCDLCYSTHAGNAAQYPQQYEYKEVMFQINHVANILLEAINRRTNGV